MKRFWEWLAISLAGGNSSADGILATLVTGFLIVVVFWMMTVVIIFVSYEIVHEIGYLLGLETT